MEIFITILASVAASMLAFILQGFVKENRKLREEKNKIDADRNAALENGVRQLLSTHLEELYEKYNNSPTISRRSYDRCQKLHAAYKGLNGNGTFDRMMEELEEKHIVN